MCRKKIYYNTYADGFKDVTEKTTACREGKMCSHPEIHQYERTFRFNKLRDAGPESHKSLADRKPTPYFLGGDLPTPRGSKSPSPSDRRGSGVYVPGSGLVDLPKPGRERDHGHYDHHDRHDRHSSHRRSSRHLDREALPSRSKRSSPHYVVIDQPGRSASRDIPLGPAHLLDEYGSRRRSSRERERHHDRDHDHHHRHRSPSSSSQGYIVDDERERRRHHRRRMSASGYTDMGGAPVLADVYTAEPPSSRHNHHSHHSRHHHHSPHGGLRRSNTLGGPTPAMSMSASPPRVRWDDEVSARRARQNAEIASRSMAPPEVHQHHQEPPKGILKDTSGGKGKGREGGHVRGRAEEYDLYNRDRLWARLGGSGGGGGGGSSGTPSGGSGSGVAEEDGGREQRRRRSKVWVSGGQYQYF